MQMCNLLQEPLEVYLHEHFQIIQEGLANIYRLPTLCWPLCQKNKSHIPKVYIAAGSPRNTVESKCGHAQIPQFGSGFQQLQVIQCQSISHLTVRENHLESLLEAVLTPEFLILQVWGHVGKFAFLMSTQVRTKLSIDKGPCLEWY